MFDSARSHSSKRSSPEHCAPEARPKAATPRTQRAGPTLFADPGCADSGARGRHARTKDSGHEAAMRVLLAAIVNNVSGRGAWCPPQVAGRLTADSRRNRHFRAKK